MNILNIENLSKTYTGRLLFHDASFFVQEGEKVGIVGINGTGKSTLLRIIAGVEEPDTGKLIMANHIVMSFLPQNPVFEEDKSIRENILLKKANETEAVTILTKLGILDFDQLVGSLSGGQKKKLALAIALSVPADLLILDEPTNHLDYGMIEWLQKYLNNYRGTILMVTHDRYFLDEICNRIVEIDQGNIYSYETDYSGFLALKTEREDSLRSSELKRKNILRRELEWMRRGARARSTKQKAHIQRYEELAAVKDIEVKDALSLSSGYARMGKTTVELENISFRYDADFLIHNFSYIFNKNDRIGFIGNNGCGKTTLLKIIAGELTPGTGTVTIGQTVKLGYYTQEVQFMNPNQRVIDFVKDIGEYLPSPEGLISATNMLERFLFTSEMQYSVIGKLSGGEKRRLALLSILMAGPNVIVLDEPTNDLDTETLAILEDYLESFQGIVITVSHDRHFLDRIVNRIFVFEKDGSLKQYEGSYSDYLYKAPVHFWEEEADVPSPVKEIAKDSKETWKKRPEKIKFSFAEQKEYETIEQDIEKLEELIADLESQMASNSFDYVKLNELSKQKEATEQSLQEKYNRWEYLEEKAKQIQAQD